MHDSGNSKESLAELATGMQIREILSAKAFVDKQGHRQRVTQRERGGRAGRGGRIQRAGFAVNAAIERHVGRDGHGAVGGSSDGDERGPEAFKRFQ